MDYMTTITKTFHFSAAHRLYRSDWSEEKNRCTFGKCHNIHGHNYVLEVSVQGEICQETSMIIDASELQKIVDFHIISKLDHMNLNEDIDWLDGLLPSTEVMVEKIWKRLEQPIKSAAPNAFLKRLLLRETQKIYAIKEI